MHKATANTLKLKLRGKSLSYLMWTILCHWFSQKLPVFQTLSTNYHFKSYNSALFPIKSPPYVCIQSRISVLQSITQINSTTKPDYLCRGYYTLILLHKYKAVTSGDMTSLRNSPQASKRPINKNESARKIEPLSSKYYAKDFLTQNASFW